METDVLCPPAKTPRMDHGDERDASLDFRMTDKLPAAPLMSVR